MIEKTIKSIPLFSAFSVIFGIAYEYGYISNIDPGILGLYSLGEIVMSTIRWLPFVVFSLLIGFSIGFVICFEIDDSKNILSVRKFVKSSKNRSFTNIFSALILVFGVYSYVSFPNGHFSNIIIVILIANFIAHIIANVSIFRIFIDKMSKFLLFMYFILMIGYSYVKGIGDFYDDSRHIEKHIISEEIRLPVVRIFQFGYMAIMDQKYLLITNDGKKFTFNRIIDLSEKSIACRRREIFCNTLLDPIEKYRNHSNIDEQ